MRIINSTSFGEALRLRRKDLGLTQKDISIKSGFSVSFISDLENGKPTAELGKALEYAELLQLSIEASPLKTD